MTAKVTSGANRIGREIPIRGRDPVEMGFAHSVIPPWSNVGMPLDEHFMSETFRDAGYQTGMIGKWHLGHHNRAQSPNARGFEYFYGNLTSGPDYYDHVSRVGGLDWQRNGTSVVEPGYSTELIADDAQRFIRDRDRKRPFFLYVPWNAPHTPLQAPKDLMAKYADQLDPQRIIFSAMTESMDTGIGAILRTLEEQGLAERCYGARWRSTRSRCCGGSKDGRREDSEVARLGRAQSGASDRARRREQPRRHHLGELRLRDVP
jgi:arylsulfatase A-like enzyme